MTRPSRRRLRAPTADGQAFIDPPLSEASKLVEANRQIPRALYRAAGFPDDHWNYARFPSLFGVDGPVDQWLALQTVPHIFSGHQPELFHPGVWLKNFVLSAITTSVGGLGINLVITSDTVRTASIRVPGGSLAAPTINDVPFDASGEEAPWEAREVLDQELFQSFAWRVRSHFSPFMGKEAYRQGLLLDELWPAAVESKERMLQRSKELLARLNPPKEFSDILPEVIAAKQQLGSSLSFARQDLEQRIGLVSRDLTLDNALMGSEFMRFADHLFLRHRELHEIYNAVLAEYRAANGIRNHLRPVPDLARAGDWYESPFWLWNAPSDVRRRKAFVRQSGSSWELSDLGNLNFRPSSETEQDMQAMSLTLAKSGPTLRPRALITTMYARLVLSDLFIHGIGGAKYDEVTDEIIRKFFGIEPPKYITATATFRLPIERPQVTIEDVREARQKLRDVRYRPENFLRDPLTKQVSGLREKLQALADEKREYVRTHDLRRCEQQVFARLDTINRAMHELLKPVEQELHAEHAQVQDDLRRADLLGSREFSFVLFPADDLPQRLLALSKVSA